ncbi:hypothetical protein F4780DRAFT_774652 [Xylariomycetidae sp. FL0641]|nr:hypothetical protein F4780DRAFT_774652 [Xylariomycetidae sp. FL0641]
MRGHKATPSSSSSSSSFSSRREPFEFVTYQPASAARAAAAGLSVKQDAFWSYVGPVLGGDDGADALPANLSEFAATSLSSPTHLHALLQPFLACARARLAAAGLAHYWLTIRATTPTPAFDVPRWHVDDLFFSSSSSSSSSAAEPADGKQQRKKTAAPSPPTDWKLCATLLGPPTQFLAAPRQAAGRATTQEARTAAAAAHPHACTAIRCAGCADAGAAVRARLAHAFGGAEAVGVAAAPGACAVFRVGERAGAVHSEPRMRAPRLFVNVVPGTEAELRDLAARWGMQQFPRAWSVVTNAPPPPPPPPRGAGGQLAAAAEVREGVAAV